MAASDIAAIVVRINTSTIMVRGGSDGRGPVIPGYSVT